MAERWRLRQTPRPAWGRGVGTVLIVAAPCGPRSISAEPKSRQSVPVYTALVSGREPQLGMRLFLQRIKFSWNHVAWSYMHAIQGECQGARFESLVASSNPSKDTSYERPFSYNSIGISKGKYCKRHINNFKHDG